MRVRLRAGLPLAILLLVTLVAFGPAVFTSGTFFSRDLLHLYYPIKQYIRDSIQAGEMPLWNPHLYCGVPFLGDFVSSVFYPLNVIFLILPMGIAFEAFIVLHYLLASVFGYLYHRSRRGSVEAALLVGVAFGFSGYLVSVHNNLVYLQTGIWTPLLLLLALRAPRGWGWAAGAALVLGVQILGGDLQGAIISGGIALAATMFLSRGAEPDSILPVRRRALAGGVMLAGGIGLAAIQWIPSAAWAALSPRGSGLSYEVATQWSMHPLQLAEMIAPGIFGDPYRQTFWGRFLVNSPFGSPWAHAVTVGTVPLFLATSTLLSRKKGREVLFWGIIGLLMLLLSFGSFVGFYRMLHLLPGFGVFRYPAKLFYFSTLSIAFLSGIAFDRLREDPSRGITALRNSFFAIAALLLLLGFFPPLLFGTEVVEGLRGMTRDIPGIDAYDALRTITMGLFRGAAVLGLFGILCHLRVKEGIEHRPFLFTLVAATALELSILSATTPRVAPADIYTRTPPTVDAVRSVGMDGYRFVRERGSLFRYDERWYRYRYGDIPDRKQRFHADSLQANLGMLFGLDDALGYSPAEPKRLLRFVTALHEDPIRMYSLLGVRALVVEKGVRAEVDPLYPLRVVVPRKDDRYAVLENPSALPGTLLLGRVIEASSDEEAFRILKEPDFDPSREVVLRGDRGGVDLGEGERSFMVREEGRQGSEFRVSGDVGSVLLRNEAWAPGWKATVDDEPAEVLQANYLMQAVEVPAGTHVVRFRYRPSSFRWGLAVALTSLLAIAALGVAGARSRGRRSG